MENSDDVPSVHWVGVGEDVNNSSNNANANVQASANSQPSQMVEPAGTPSSRRRPTTADDALIVHPTASANANDRHQDYSDPDEDEEDEEDEDEDEDEEDEDEEDEDEDDEEDEGPVVVKIPQANVRGMSSIYSGYSSSRFVRGPRYDLSGAPAGAGINYMFYAGKAPSHPDRVHIHEFHERWWAEYRRLEYEHGFIQWLFPVFESSGVNWDAEALSKSEAKLMREDFVIATRVIRSYRLMLNFYGIRLVSEVTGEVARWPGIWRDRYDNLNWSGHNNLRITRILTSLGELGFQRYKKPLLDFLATEITQNRQLPNCRSSLLSFWSKTLDYSSPSYKMKTKEDPQDREDSVFFRHMEENSVEYQKWVEEEAKELAQRERGLEEAQRRDDEEEQRRKEKGETADSSSSSLWHGGGYGSRWSSRWKHEAEDDEEDEDDDGEEEDGDRDDSGSEGEKAERVVSENEDIEEDDDDGDEGDGEDDDKEKESIIAEEDGEGDHDDKEEDKGKGKL